MVQELGDGKFLFKNGAIAVKKENGQYKIIGFDKEVSAKFRAKKNGQKGGKTKKGPNCQKTKQKGGKIKKSPNNKSSVNQRGGAKNKDSEKLKLTVRMLREFYSKI